MPFGTALNSLPIDAVGVVMTLRYDLFVRHRTRLPYIPDNHTNQRDLATF